MFSFVLYDELPKAVVTVPVADVIRSSLQDLVSAEEVYQAYQSLDYKETDEESLHERAYQLLFNEEVGVVACRGDEVLVRIPHIYCKEDRGALPQQCYWMLKDALLYLDDLCETGVNCSYLPLPLKASYKSLEECNQNVITLAMPYRDPKTNSIYSAGTRFVRTDTNESADSIMVYTLNSNTLLYDMLTIPRSICIVYERKSKSERVGDFLFLIRQWMKSQGGVIPYVWGGSSFTHYVMEHETWKKSIRLHSVYTAPMFTSYPYAGFDCSCLIWRASLAVGIPYFFANSRVMKEHMQALVPGENVKEGDILWFEGHVMIAGSIEDNTVIEARGYGAGYGRLHELPLNQMFADIATYAELEQACFNHQPITLLHRDGSVRLVIPEFKILSFQDSWSE